MLLSKKTRHGLTYVGGLPVSYLLETIHLTKKLIEPLRLCSSFHNLPAALVSFKRRLCHLESRFRPMNKLEVQQNSQDCIEINDEASTVYMKHAASLGKLLRPGVLKSER